MNKMHPFNLQNGFYWDNKISVSADMVTCNSNAELDTLDEENTQMKRSSQVVRRENNLTK